MLGHTSFAWEQAQVVQRIRQSKSQWSPSPPPPLLFSSVGRPRAGNKMLVWCWEQCQQRFRFFPHFFEQEFGVRCKLANAFGLFHSHTRKVSDCGLWSRFGSENHLESNESEMLWCAVPDGVRSGAGAGIWAHFKGWRNTCSCSGSHHQVNSYKYWGLWTYTGTLSVQS